MLFSFPARPVNILIIVILKSLSDGYSIQVIFKSGFHFRMPSGPFFFFFKAYTSRMGTLLKVNNLAQALKLGC